MKTRQTVISIGLLCVLLSAGIADANAELVNGANQYGTLQPDTIDYYTFAANAGDVINVRLGTTNFQGYLELDGPTGAKLAYSVGGTDNYFEYTATNSGTFTVQVSCDDLGGPNSGTYVLRLAQTPEPFVVPAGDEGGPLTNGATYYGVITLADIDMWTVTANAGDVINLRLGTTNFQGHLELFGPTGVKLAEDIGGDDDYFEYTATNIGTFTVLVSCDDLGGANSGTYVLRLAQTPEPFVVPAGDEGGPMTSGTNYYGVITLADMDLWTLKVFRGDVINLNLDTTNFQGHLELFGPAGTMLAYDISSSQNSIEYDATNSGTFTVLVSCYDVGNANSGSYGLRLDQTHEAFVVPCGILTNGANETGAIPLNNTNLYTFTANANDSIFLRLGTTNFNGELQLYGPDGSPLATTAQYASSDVSISGYLPANGTYTVLLNSQSAGGTGTYIVRLAQFPEPYTVPPGDEGGLLTGAQHYNGQITLGDIDMWSFTAFAGDPISLELKTTNFYGLFQLYAPNGSLYVTSANLTNTDIIISGQVQNNGVFTALVTGQFPNSTGTYGLTVNGLSGGLKISNPVISGTNFSLIGAGGTSNGVVVLYSSTNIAMPFGLWTPVLTNHFDPLGVFSATNVYNPALQNRGYFRFVMP